MTNGNGANESRLDRIEAILETLAVELRETRQLTESNARSIQAWESRIDENRDAARQERAEINRNVSDLQSTVSTLADIVSIHEQQHQESMQRHEESMRRHEESERRADADRALMLRLIESIAQGRNGGE